MPQMISGVPTVLNCRAAGDTTVTWGNLASGTANLMGMDTGPMPLMLLAALPRIIRSAPTPLLRALVSLRMPMKMPTMERIMMTSMATATTLMRERRGRCTRLAKISLFILERTPQGALDALIQG